ncbi:MAG: type II toxin-antitoxin system VapC family toxin [Cyanobacteria bacterium P01_E01_bin.34]
MYLVDTNVLLRAQQPQSIQFSDALLAVETLQRRGEVLGIVPQVIAEFWNVCTRPSNRNGLGLSPEVAEQKLRAIELAFTLFTGSELEVYQQWRELIVIHQVKGVQVHDAKLVASMFVHEITHVLTFNGKDFQRFPNIKVVDPSSIATGL